jgi:hypothetical protein
MHEKFTAAPALLETIPAPLLNVTTETTLAGIIKEKFGELPEFASVNAVLT